MTLGASGRLFLIIGPALAALCAAVLTINASFGYICSKQLHTKAEFADLFAQRTAFTALVDEETGVRGYIAGRDPGFLEPYRAGQHAYAAYRSGPARDDAAAGATAVGRFVATGDALQPYFRGQVAEVAAGHADRAVAALPAGKRLFDRLRRQDALAMAALQRSLEADSEGARAAVALARVATLILVFVLAAGGAVTAVLVLLIRAGAVTARRDELTSLGNRLSFEERLASALAARSGDDMIGVLYIDLDGFKPVNDAHGHGVGDQVLAACGARLRNAVRPGDFVGRIGGDEFVAILAPVRGLIAARTVAARATRAIEEPLAIGGKTIRLGASIGIAMSPGDGSSAADLVRAADAAMFVAKRARRFPAAG